MASKISATGFTNWVLKISDTKVKIKVGILCRENEAEPFVEAKLCPGIATKSCLLSHFSWVPLWMPFLLPRSSVHQPLLCFQIKCCSLLRQMCVQGTQGENSHFISKQARGWSQQKGAEGRSVGLNGSVMVKMTCLSFTYFFHFIKEQKIHIWFHRGRLIRSHLQLEFVTVVAKWITLAYYKVINKIVSPSLPSVLGELCSLFACLFGFVSTLYKACPHWSSLHGCVLTVDAELMSCEAMFESLPFLEQVAHFQRQSKYNAKACAKYCAEPLGNWAVKKHVHV